MEKNYHMKGWISGEEWWTLWGTKLTIFCLPSNFLFIPYVHLRMCFFAYSLYNETGTKQQKTTSHEGDGTLKCKCLHQSNTTMFPNLQCEISPLHSTR